MTHFDILRYNLFIKKKSIEKKKVILGPKIQYGRNLKSMVFMEKVRVQLTFIFNHKYIHYINFKHLSILRKYIFEKNRHPDVKSDT